MSRYPKFRKALQKWRKVALAELWRHPDQNIMHVGTIQWHRETTGHMRKRIEVEWNLGYVFRELTQLPAWAELTQVAQNTEDIAKHLDQLVGTAYARVQMQLGLIAYSFLRMPELLKDGSHITLKPDRFAEQYAQFEDFIARDHIDMISIWPISGLMIEKSLRVHEHALIRKLSDEETAACISGGVIPVAQGRELILEPESRYCGLVIETRMQKLIGDTNEKHAITEALEKEKSRLIENCEIVASLIGVHNIRFSGQLERAAGWSPLPRSFSMSNKPTSSRLAHFNPDTMTKKVAGNFRYTWNLLFAENYPKDQSLYLAARRLAFAHDRIRGDDRLLDLMIAAEALYLNDTGSPQEKGELKFRLALRAASWADPSKISMSKKDVYQLMRTAYNVRSLIVHGGIPKYDEPELFQLALNRDIEEVVRQGLRKALIQSARTRNKKFKPDWEEGILEKLSH